MISKTNWEQNTFPLYVKTIPEIVSLRTGMNNEELLKDATVYTINNMDEAVDLFWDCYKKGMFIYGFSDYDADGIDSSLVLDILFNALRIKNTKITVPRRFTDGYGMKTKHVAEIKNSLIITVDNGIASHEAIKIAKENGNKVIILDHHIAKVDENKEVILPEADIVIDPHVTGGTFEDYCGAGLAFKFAVNLLRRKPHGLSDSQEKYIIALMSCFAAIGTVADAVSLTGENRKIVKHGLRCMEKKYCSMGLQLLLSKFYLGEYITATDIGFKLGPAINAYGRLEDKGSRKVFRALSYNGKYCTDAVRKIEEMYNKNNERKAISNAGYERCKAMIESKNLSDSKFIVLYDKDCSAGIAGLVAGKLTEEYDRPVVILTPTSDLNIIKGSGRSPSWANLEKILTENASLIVSYGGHPEACGISIEKKNFEAFVEAVNNSTPNPPEKVSSALMYDIQISTDEVEYIMNIIDTYGPYGNGNPEIVVRIDDIQLISNENNEIFKTMGQVGEHIKLFSKNMDLIMFEGTKEWNDLGSPDKISVIGTLSRNVFRGNSRIQMQVIDMIPA